MKIALVVCCLMAASLAMIKERPRYVEGQFILRLDEQMVKTEAEEAGIAKFLFHKYGMGLLKSLAVGKLRFFLLQGNDKYLNAISQLHFVKYIERNALGYVDQCSEQPSPGTYGLDRIDQREALTYSDPLSDEATYTYGENQGEDVSVYVIDTGVEVSHENFDGRVRWGYNDPSFPSEDDHGHGTHCAGTVGSRDYGVAKAVEIVAVKVVNSFGSGSTDQFVGGANWVLSDHLARFEASGVMPKSVMSASLGYSPSQAIDDSIQELYDNGVSIAVSAGNDSGDACGQSPARSPAALGTGSTTVGDGSSWFSNYGPCVGVYAPGSNVLSTVNNGGTDVFSGTSMAAPHVAGAMARYISSFNVAPTPSEVHGHIVSSATVDAISWFDDSHSVSDNLLLYSEC